MAPCADCFSGHLAEGTPVGKVETIHGLSTYVSHPPAGVKPKGLIVYLPDAFGWEFKNSRLLCDKYAEKVGALVWMPDFMDGMQLGDREHQMEANVLQAMHRLLT